MSLARPRAVLLDWDNTLVDSFPAIHGAMNDALTAMGHEPWSFDEFCARIALSMRDIFPRLFGDRVDEAQKVFYASYATRHLDSIQPLPGAAALLESLSESGFYLGVVSNKNGDYLREEVNHLGWQGYFGKVVGAMDAAEDKPSPLVIQLALEGSDIAPGVDVWFVGDNAVDIECAEAAGCLALVIHGAHASGKVEALDRAARQFANCTELADLVRAL